MSTPEKLTSYCLTSPCGDTLFCSSGEQPWLNRLFGMACGENSGPNRRRGLALISSSEGRFEGVDLRLASIKTNEGGLELTWKAGSLELASSWSLDAATGILNRKDKLANRGDGPVTLYRCLARFTFTSGPYEIYRQDSRWSNENLGAWSPVVTGSTSLANEWGRTTHGSTPYLCLRPVDVPQGIAFHILPQGNWTLRVSAFDRMSQPPQVLVELGLADEDLHFILQPGQVLDLPEILVQALPQGEPRLAAPAFHRFVLEHYFANAKRQPPVVCNTWFHEFDHLDVDRLRDQLQAARELGCEAFVIDAGWFGPQTPGWSRAVGDWREKLDASFYGKMADFADEVRAQGLGFGIWMEPERFQENSPVCQSHPEWFRRADGEFFRIDLEKPGAYAYLKGEITRLIETYRLAWMKVDFNFELGYDASGAELSGYYRQWYRMLDEIHSAYPDTFFEGCSSGGLRLDLNTLRHFDGHFLTDTVNPTDVLRIAHGAMLRLPPCRYTRWAVLRSAGNHIPFYSDPMQTDWPATLVTPSGAGWQPAECVDLDFAVLAALPGIFGLSGDIAGLPGEVRQRLRSWIEVYKQWRGFITGSIAHLLTPLRPIEDRDGWVAFQLQQPGNPAALLFVYRLFRSSSQMRFQLKDLDAQLQYRAFPVNVDQGHAVEMAGYALMSEGLPVDLPGVNTARLYQIVPVG
ncbi:MAG: glycoside hydrolase family 36 protein [Omnitrophica WOR_2 bacterium]